MGVETAGKILGFVTAVLSVVATVAVTYVLRWWVPQQAIRTLRDELEWHVQRLAEKDTELRQLRLEVEASSKRLEALDVKYELLRESDRDRRAQMYGCARYVRRLEGLLRKHNIPLPPDDRRDH